MKTISAKKEEVKRDWYVVDADGMVLGRLASRVATVLRGKHKPIFTPHVDTGDFVIIVNASKVKFTGAKLVDKMYHYHTGYPGGLRGRSLGKFLKEKPEELIRHSIGGMLPKNKLGREMLKKLKVYSGPEHPHSSQLPRLFSTGE